jgi:FixJ family two-component response regulator
MALEKKQIFVVDDDESVCRALSALLGTYGCMVDTYASAEEYFRTVPDSVSGCLILDLHMPRLDGWETMRHLRSSGSKRPVIIITADKAGGLREQVLKTGAAGFLQKPFNDHALVGLIMSVFKKKGSMAKTKQ